MLKRQLALLDEFPNAPFTLQRLCELLIAPRAMYATSTRKLMNAVEKLLTVSSAVPTMQVAADPRSACLDAGRRMSRGPLMRMHPARHVCSSPRPARRSRRAKRGRTRRRPSTTLPASRGRWRVLARMETRRRRWRSERGGAGVTTNANRCEGGGRATARALLKVCLMGAATVASVGVDGDDVHGSGRSVGIR